MTFKKAILSMYLTESEIRQLDMLREKTPAQRYVMMSQLIAGQFEAMKAGIRHAHPGAVESEIDEWFKIKMKKIYLLKR